MAQAEKAKVFKNGRSQAVRIPAKYRFAADEVYVRRDEKSGDLILSQRTGDFDGGWKRLAAAIQAEPFPEEFLADREPGVDVERESL